MTEVELKFLVDEPATTRLQAALEGWPGAARPRRRTLCSTYYDTADQALRHNGIGLRLRRDGRRWMQTVKLGRTLSGGLSQAEELECPAPRGRLALDRLPAGTLAEELARAIGGQPLAPVCETDFRRSSVEVSLADGTRAEVALDIGCIRAGSRSQDLCEVEIELIAGNAGALYRFARELLAGTGFRFSRLPKLGRGHLLAETGAIEEDCEPRRARPVPLSPGMTAELAARDILRECLSQVAANVEATLATEEPEGPHQLRVGLRRMRTALALFRPAIGGPEATRLAAEARWLGREVGALRDLDVVLAALSLPRHGLPDGPGDGAATLLAALEHRRGQARQRVAGVLGSAQAGGFLIDMACFVETRGWLAPRDLGQTERLGQPVGRLARAALRKRWHAVEKRAGALPAGDFAAAHELRKRIKTLRYAWEFLSELHLKSGSHKLRLALKRLQDRLGALPDALMTRDLLAGIAAAEKDPAASYVAGLVVGARIAGAEQALSEARGMWRRMRRAEPRW